jgi:hypothetical protein
MFVTVLMIELLRGEVVDDVLPPTLRLRLALLICNSIVTIASLSAKSLSQPGCTLEYLVWGVVLLCRRGNLSLTRPSCGSGFQYEPRFRASMQYLLTAHLFCRGKKELGTVDSGDL